MRYAHAHRVLAPVLAMKNEHWLGLASDGCKLLSRFHSRFHLRFQFEVRGSAQVTCRDLRGPRSNLLLFFATIREIHIAASEKYMLKIGEIHAENLRNTKKMLGFVPTPSNISAQDS